MAGLPTLPITPNNLPTAEFQKICTAMCDLDSSFVTMVPQIATPEPFPLYFLPIGQPVGLTALLPTPGAILPASPAQPVSQLPLQTIVSARWQVMQRNVYSSDSYMPARAADSLVDALGHYQIIEGSSASLSMSFLPWPVATEFSITPPSPCNKVRTFRVSLQVHVWWPGRTDNSWSDVATFYFGVESWQTAIPGSAQDGSWRLNSPQAATAAGPLMSLFSIPQREFSPAPGDVVKVLVKANDGNDDIPQIVQSVVQSTPSLNVQAAVDLGAMFANIIKTATSIIPGLPKEATDGFEQSEVAVDRLIKSALSIPLALDVNGSAVSKTLTPLIPALSTSLRHVTDTGSLFGQLPFGKLLAFVRAEGSELDITRGTPLSGAADMLQNSLGFALQAVPLFGPVTDPVQPSTKTEAIQLRIVFTLQVPGISALATNLHLRISIDLGEIRIHWPVIPLPNVLIALQHSSTNKYPNINGNVLVVMDPPTSKLFNDDVQSLQQHLLALKKLLTPLKDLMLVAPADSEVKFQVSLLETLSAIILWLSAAPCDQIYFLPLDGNVSGQSVCRDWGSYRGGRNLWYEPGNDPKKTATNIFWIGYPYTIPSFTTYRPRIKCCTPEGVNNYVTFGWEGSSSNALDCDLVPLPSTPSFRCYSVNPDPKNPSTPNLRDSKQWNDGTYEIGFVLGGSDGASAI